MVSSITLLLALCAAFASAADPPSATVISTSVVTPTSSSAVKTDPAVSPSSSPSGTTTTTSVGTVAPAAGTVADNSTHTATNTSSKAAAPTNSKFRLVFSLDCVLMRWDSGSIWSPCWWCGSSRGLGDALRPQALCSGVGLRIEEMVWHPERGGLLLYTRSLQPQDNCSW